MSACWAGAGPEAAGRGAECKAAAGQAWDELAGAPRLVPSGDDQKNGPWKPNYAKAAEALARNHTTLTKPTRANLGWDPTWANSTANIKTTGFCCSP